MYFYCIVLIFVTVRIVQIPVQVSLKNHPCYTQETWPYRIH